MAEDQLSSPPLTPDPARAHPARPEPARHDEETLAALAAADRMLEEMSDGFNDEARQQIETIQAAVDAHDADTADDCARHAHIDTVFKASHELRGQAGTFGYGLLSELCHSLCILLELEKKLDNAGRPARPGNRGVWDAIVHHANAVTTIVESDLKGDGGDRGRELSAEVARLRNVLEHGSA